jgi:DNA-directed RNA polymerase subunit RPC12/RpoP
MLSKINNGSGQKMAPQLRINIPLNQMQDIVCSECGGVVFMPALRFKEISAILSQTGKEEVAALETLICATCHKELESMRDIMEDK